MENRSVQPHNHKSYAKEEIKSRKRKETIEERRRRFLGTASVRFTTTTDQDAADQGALCESDYSRRRHQVRRAQRYHRQRTLDYIQDLETEITRLRGSCENTVDGDGKNPYLQSLTSNGPPILGGMNVSVLVEAFDGQIAPGVCLASHAAGVPHYQLPHIFEPSSRPYVATPTPLNLEFVDPWTRMLFYNFSQNIAPTLVVFDGPSNGFRYHMLPLAWDIELVRYALLAMSANHMRFRRHQLLPLALTFQSAAIEKLSAMSKMDNYTSDTSVTVLATIILLLITDMMNGGPQFHLLFGMVTSWVDATNCGSVPLTYPTHRSDIEVFLLDQLDMVHRYAKPLTIERHVIREQRGSTLLTIPTGTLKDNLTRIFKSISEAIKYTCYIYYYHIMNDTPPLDIEHVLNKLKDATQHIPPYAPGENSLAWVYFVAAAESSVPIRRLYFTKRLLGLFERGNFSNPTPAFVILHHIWNCHDFDRSWTKHLRDQGFFSVTLSPT
ncbi:hypothetical protein TsFJ059_008263 [Trichoderma semiorbis]|uniref:Uncharacterized protein n=1 Tax=Trichoderma semiorbis TaxID=1491008 RepID=A0A9P8H9V4_9HYPO|nr:hypothetical protein TsFJ059_008263 [Trichoderma semiorbis]